MAKFDFGKKCLYYVDGKPYLTLTQAHEVAVDILKKDPKFGNVPVIWINENGEEFKSGFYYVSGYCGHKPNIAWLHYDYRE